MLWALCFISNIPKRWVLAAFPEVPDRITTINMQPYAATFLSPTFRTPILSSLGTDTEKDER